MSKMDDRYIADNDVIKRYLKDKLTPEETIRFEEYILDKPELLEQLVVDAVLVENYSIALDEVDREETENSESIFMSFIKSLWSKPLIHSAASFAIGAAVVLSINGNNVALTPYSGTIDLVELSPLRSSSAEDVPDATYSLSNKADHIMLLIQPGFIEAESALVKITRRSDNTNVFSAQVAVNNSGDVVVYLKKVALEPGLFAVSLSETDVTSDTSQLLLSITP